MNILKKIYYKMNLDIIWNRFMSGVARYTRLPLQIMSANDTIDYIRKHNCSVARFGDGELHIAAYGCALKFQRADKQLQEKLIQVLKSNNPNLLLCLPDRLNAITETQRSQLSPFWRQALKVHLYPWTKHVSKKRLYGDTNMSRLTEPSPELNRLQIQNIKKIWECRNVIMVEGCKTRFGVGNDLFDNVRSLKRILGPAESAFDHYEEIFKKTQDFSLQVSDPLVIIALGPTATVLASDLADSGIQAVDIGHFDIGYEKLRRGISGAVPGKYTNEADGGDIVGDCTDQNYLSQIVAQIPKLNS